MWLSLKSWNNQSRRTRAAILEIKTGKLLISVLLCSLIRKNAKMKVMRIISYSVQYPQSGKMPVTLWRLGLNICRDAATLLNQFYSNQQRPQKSAKPWGFAFWLTTVLRKRLQANMTTWISQFFIYFSYTSKGILLIRNWLNYAW